MTWTSPLCGALRCFDAAPDPRRFNVTYTLPQLLTLTLMAVLCRCDNHEEIAAWVQGRRGWPRCPRVGCLDVSFHDDACRVRKHHGPTNLAAVKRLTLNLVKTLTGGHQR